MHTTEVILVIIITCIIVGLVTGLAIHQSIKASRFNSYDNKKNANCNNKLDTPW